MFLFFKNQFAQQRERKRKMIELACNTYPVSDKEKVFSLQMIDGKFLLTNQPGSIFQGNRVHLFSQLPDDIVNDISLYSGDEEKEVFRSAKLKPEMYIQKASGELSFYDTQNREWKIVIIPIEHYQGGKNYIFSLYQWPEERLWQFMPSFLSWSCFGDFLAIENGAIRIGRNMNQNRHMLRVKNVLGDITFVGDNSISLTYPVDPGDYRGKIQDGIVTLPTRVLIKGSSFYAWHRNKEEEKEILEEECFSNVKGSLMIKTEDGLRYSIQVQKIAGFWRFVMTQAWDNGIKNIVDIGDQIRFSCLKAPDGTHPELKFIGLETEYGMSVPFF